MTNGEIIDASRITISKTKYRKSLERDYKKIYQRTKEIFNCTRICKEMADDLFRCAWSAYHKDNKYIMLSLKKINEESMPFCNFYGKLVAMISHETIHMLLHMQFNDNVTCGFDNGLAIDLEYNGYLGNAYLSLIKEDVDVIKKEIEKSKKIYRTLKERELYA
jgi:hypothetical protein